MVEVDLGPAMILNVINPLRVDGVLGDRPFAEIGEPVLAVMAEGSLAVAGEYVHESGQAPVAVYDSHDLSCRAVLRSRFPVHALAFHPTLPLLAVGTGKYDGGYFFEGALLLLNWETHLTVSSFEDGIGREVLGLEWLDDHALRLLLAPPDDWQDKAAWVEGHVAVVRRADWDAVGPGTIDLTELAGPRFSAPRSDGRAEAEAALSRLSGNREPRRSVRAIEELSDGRILAALAGIAVECWLPSGEVSWRIPDDDDSDGGGQELAVAPDERSVWAGLMRPYAQQSARPLVRYSVADGARIDGFSPQHPYTLVQCHDGLPAIAPADMDRMTRLRVRRGRRIYFQEVERTATRWLDPTVEWLSAADPMAAGPDGRPCPAGDPRRLFRYSWVPDESHFAGPGVEIADGSLVYAGTVYHGHGLQPGGAFVVRRDVTTGDPHWVFRADCAATDLDADTDTVYVGYQDGDIIALDLQDGSVRWRQRLQGVFPTALTAVAADRLLIGTSDGRVLTCRIR
ncbi:hypothetical protein FB565_008769 [Actinoplanes lutulentus]|uniref:outer membrane protein assembly factor BamB family protein n=1 Tax=Actinoplanes lutulentus TaxID=1287878 RepID=UPI0015ECB312|nr:PQQ-binding-like beta-propeller repeat protein [Actinoplanes lutulentus]MBB2948983.1 hypothetical protein [Actinoplanes lutulentus]